MVVPVGAEESGLLSMVEVLLGISLAVNVLFIWMFWYGLRIEKRIEKETLKKVGKKLKSQGGQTYRRYSA